MQLEFSTSEYKCFYTNECKFSSLLHPIYIQGYTHSLHIQKFCNMHYKIFSIRVIYWHFTKFQNFWKLKIYDIWCQITKFQNYKTFEIPNSLCYLASNYIVSKLQNFWKLKFSIVLVLYHTITKLFKTQIVFGR